MQSCRGNGNTHGMGWEWEWEWERFFPCGDPHRNSHRNPHRNPHGDSHRIPMGIPMGIPTGFLWEWDGNGNSIPTATVARAPSGPPLDPPLVLTQFLELVGLVEMNELKRVQLIPIELI